MEGETPGSDASVKPGVFFRLNPFKRRPPPVPVKREVGYQRPLELNDIWLVNPDRGTRLLANRLKQAFQDNRAKGEKKPLLWALIRTFKKDLIVGGAASFLANITQVIIPFVIKYIIAFAAEAYYAAQLGTPQPAIGRGVGLVVGITVMQILGSIGNNHFFYRGMIVGGQARSALMSIIFDKAMTISGRAKAGHRAENFAPPGEGVKPGSDEEKKHLKAQLETPEGKGGKKGKAPDSDLKGWSNGRIINLMSVDTYRIDQGCGWLHMAWTSPISMIVTVALLIVNLTYSALVGVAVFSLGIPILGLAVKSMFKRRGQINKLTDERVNITQEVLQAIRFVKYYAWEDDFLKRLTNVRNREIGSIRRLLTTRNAIMSVGTAIPIFAAMLSFITFSLTSHALNPAPVFSSLALFNQLRMPLVILPMVLGFVSDALQSVQRIEEFLLAEDTVESEVTMLKEGFNALDLTDASFTWEQSAAPDEEAGAGAKGPMSPEAKMKQKKAKADAKKQAKQASKEGGVVSQQPVGAAGESEKQDLDRPPFTLDHINLQAAAGELIGVVGSVGSGKSSLLSAIAGEMRRTDGSLVVNGSRALCAQLAWIRNANVRDNISFGSKFDQTRYNDIIEACSLTHDLKILPKGSDTEIGERGINLSGGQKQRISLARAIYSNADLILLDDPLAAVDAHVGSHIMDNAICGLLRDKCRILATHQLHVLYRCDRIVMMDKGRIAACDTFQNLSDNNEAFRKMMETSKNSGTEEKEETEETEKALKKQITVTEAQDTLMQEEDRAVSGISWAVYRDYWRSSGSLVVPFLVLLVLILSQGANILTSLWLAWWSSNNFNFSMGAYIGGYAGLGVLQALLMFAFTISVSMTGTEASKRMFQQAINHVLHAPVSFFDTTPLGRIMNRFSKDIDVMDNNLSESLRMAGITTAMLISIIILTIAYYYFFAVALVPLFIFYMFSAAYYRASAREIKRFESVLRSSVFARFNEAVIGASTIRAYGSQSEFSDRLIATIDEMDSAYYLTFANQRWLGVRLDAIGVIFMFVTGMLVVTNRFSIDPSISGLILSYLVAIAMSLQFTVRQIAEVENDMNAAERVHYYGRSVPQENLESSGPQPPPSWPDRGHIVFTDVAMRYREKLPLVLHQLNLDVKPGERVGVVGRTGAGKSSIMATLFRLVELSSGSISIDGIDIRKVSLQTLRSRMSIIPQDPTLFRGTVRSNLDPFGTHADHELWSALRQAHLIDDDSVGAVPALTEKEEAAGGSGGSSDGEDSAAPSRILAKDPKAPTESTRITLDSTVENDGTNFSLGQRQLMALARAVVRGSRVIVCDEATSSIDFESDAKVQQTILHGFAGRTLLCIAHRLRTIISYDRVCVVDDGRVAEIGSPLELFLSGGAFSKLCEQSQITAEDITEAQREAARYGSH